jgi:hypothetical protein
MIASMILHNMPEDNRNQDVDYDYSSIGTPHVLKIGWLERFVAVYR